MTGTPAQDRALAYLRRKGRDATAASVRSRVGSTFGRLEARLAEIEARTARAKPDADTWCVQEVVNHLALSVEPAVGQLQALIDGEYPGEPIPASLLDDDAMAASWPESVDRLAAGHARFLETLDRAIEAEPPLDRMVRALLLIKVDDGSGDHVPLEWIEPLDWKSFALLAHVHGLEHLDQIGRILARVDPS